MLKAHSETVTIRNRLGLHARAANLFVRTANQFNAEITVGKGSQKVNGKSILGILTLAAGYNSKVTIEAEGVGAKEAVTTLAQLVRDRFEEGDDE
jgi:phosphocarrier protein HPr